jgi:hypothetical protein
MLTTMLSLTLHATALGILIMTQETIRRFYGKIYPQTSPILDDVFTTTLELIGDNSQQRTTVEATYSIVDYIFKDGKNIIEERVVNFDKVLRILQYSYMVEAECEELGENKYRLREIRNVEGHI